MSPLLAEAVPAGTSYVAVPVQDPAPPPDRGEEFGKASPVALVVILALAVVTILLIRGMSKRISRLPASFEAAGKEEGEREGDKREPKGGAADGPSA
ncbi:MAG TPA: hypothetical protein VKZ81_22805 [Pseudonocardia sp.]|jgi:hypothetical protein|uniref:hypothetical protein n=1 Tax=Pseudonocardia sp. TaxID=60912 RepID=UPI002B4B45DD|nr:hypothetical protein [Pseudonocardia sp.]HLU58300.1 hypothetical protein [Pseudonocardia sp.]